MGYVCGTCVVYSYVWDTCEACWRYAWDMFEIYVRDIGTCPVCYKFVCRWRVRGHAREMCWEMPGKGWGYVWDMFGKYLGPALDFFGTRFAYMFGLCLGHVWDMCGTSVAYTVGM